ncbi:MAG: methionyl-tRNA formyltransferase [Patescibacteria group bacterium]|nr:methionyl-tRNA formyltransferase [Patescibacteria group bacterium]
MKRNVKDLKIIFMGTPHIAMEILAFLIDSNLNITCVVTQPDRPFGRKKETIPSLVKNMALQNEIEVFQTEKIDHETIAFFKEKKPDLIILVAFGILLPNELLEIPTFGSINIHPSLLPKFRGPSPIQTALLKGESQTGISIMLMSKKMDAGPILAQKKIEVGKNENYQELEKHIIEISKDLLLDTMKQWITKKITPKTQDESKASFCEIISKRDGFIDWKQTSYQIFNQYRAFSKWPKIYSFWNDKKSKKKIIFNQIQVTSQTFPEKKPGEIFQIDNKVLIATNNGAIILKIITPEGKNEMKIQEFVNGKPHFIGSKFE